MRAISRRKLNIIWREWRAAGGGRARSRVLIMLLSGGRTDGVSLRLLHRLPSCHAVFITTSRTRPLLTPRALVGTIVLVRRRTHGPSRKLCAMTSLFLQTPAKTCFINLSPKKYCSPISPHLQVLSICPTRCEDNFSNLPIFMPQTKMFSL